MSIPGLDELPQNNYNEVSGGGFEFDWMKFEERKRYTNAFITKDGKVQHNYARFDTESASVSKIPS